MLEFKVNQDKLEAKINSNVQSILEDISNNCKEGVAITEYYVDKHIFMEVRKRLEAYLNEKGVNFKRVNIDGYMSVRYGDERFAKIKIND